MNIILGIIFTIIILSIVVIVHEGGHFILARLNGMFVKEFSVGFGPRLLSLVSKKSGTRFSLKAIPLGGSCQMLGQFEDEDEGTDDEKSFESKSVWARISVILAGPIFNVILAFVLAVIYVAVAGYDSPYVTSVAEGSAAEEAGLMEGDIITSYDSKGINLSRELYLEEYLHPVESSKTVEVSYTRDGSSYTCLITPSKTSYFQLGFSYTANESEAEISSITDGSAFDEAGIKSGDVITGVNGVNILTGEELASYFSEHEVTEEPVEITYLHRGSEHITSVTPKAAVKYSLGFSYNLTDAKCSARDVLKYSAFEVKYQILSVYKSLGLIFSGRGSLDMFSGPVGVVEVVGDTVESVSPYGAGAVLLSLLSLTILITANLGVLNLLPIPALDGGKFIILLIEAIIRKRVPKRIEGVITMIGAGLLFVFVAVVMFNDFLRFF